MSSNPELPKGVGLTGHGYGSEASVLGFRLEQLAISFLLKRHCMRGYGLPGVRLLLFECVDGYLWFSDNKNACEAKVYRRSYDRRDLASVTYGVPLSLMNLPLQPRAQAYAELIRVATRSLADFMSKKEPAFQASEFLEDIDVMLKEYLSLERPLPPSENINRHLETLRKVGILNEEDVQRTD